MLLVSLSSGPRAQAQSPACVPGEGGGCIYIQCHKGQGERGRGSIAIESEGELWKGFYTPLLSERLLRTSSSLFGSVGS